MNPAMAHAASFDQSSVPKRSHSGREILYIQNQRIVGSSQHLASHQLPNDFLPQQRQPMLNSGIPADVQQAFNSLRGYSYRELYHWLKLDRQSELRQSSLRHSSIPENHVAANPRLSIASHESASGASSIFSSATPQRMSIASTNTAYSHFSDPGLSFSVPMHGLVEGGLTPEGLLARKKSTSSLMLNSPSKPPSARSTLTAPLPRPSPRQSQSELEAKKKYFCTSCNKGFARKYDWKVHEQRYHEQQKQYPCPDCNVVLHAETLFKSHHRDSHGCQDCNHAKTREREVEDSRRRTAWGCGFCGELLDDWEKRCDHVSAHYDEGIKRDSWDHSKVILGLLKQDDIDEHWRTILIRKHGPVPNPPLAMRWSKDATGRSHGENSQQLQDLLEFGATSREPEEIAQMAYDLGLRTSVDMTSVASPPALTTSESSSTSPVEKSESGMDMHDQMTASPTTITPDSTYQSMNHGMSTTANGDHFPGMTPQGMDIKPQLEYHQQQHLQQQMQNAHMSQQHQLESPINMWSQYDQALLMQQQHQQQQHQQMQQHQQQQHQQMQQQHQQHQQLQYAQAQHYHHPMQQPQQVQIGYVDKALPPIPCDASEMALPMHNEPTTAYDNWGLSASLMGTTLGENDGMMSATVFNAQQF